jgi:hypothetical protein
MEGLVLRSNNQYAKIVNPKFLSEPKPWKKTTTLDPKWQERIEKATSHGAVTDDSDFGELFKATFDECLKELSELNVVPTVDDQKQLKRELNENLKAYRSKAAAAECQQSLKDDICDQIDRETHILRVIRALVTKLYEKFLHETSCDMDPSYFTVKGNSLRIRDAFYDDLQSECEEIGTKMSTDYHVEQLKNLKLHKKLFAFCQERGLDEKTAVKFIDLCHHRYHELVNLPGIKNRELLKIRVDELQKEVRICDYEGFVQKYNINQCDFEKLVGVFKNFIQKI